ncbi:LssY C-terminal domain-containing protein [Schlesneria paludicola]|uniref:LssY C-terminal domain-containing protein n=1 Tax=Schlesneria paludicola TaxID=360056 RepID=UPI00029AF78A|nr:LssY C-terminal domain-containing protein [Schlesneria paludicola]
MFSLFGLNYTPHPEVRPDPERAQTQRDELVDVTVSVLTPTECLQMLGVPLSNRGIQAVWIRVVNHSDSPARLLASKIAANYYTAREAAGNCHFSIIKRILAYGFLIWLFLLFLPLFALIMPFKIWAVRRANRQMKECFQRLGFPLKMISPGKTAEGLVFIPAEFGTKVIDVGLLIGKSMREYLFTVSIPSPTVDHRLLNESQQQLAGDIIDCDLATLKEKLADLPPTTTNASGTRHGDPLNLVVIGDFDLIIAVLAARWDQTELITLGSCYRTAKAFLFGSEYRYSPVSALYLYRRAQDFALQRVRGSINERLHLRLWRTHFRCGGQAVWVGQVSRDIGVRFTTMTWNLTTHLIDPDVDEARDYLLEDLFEAQRLASAGYLQSTVPCTPEAPRRNLTGDPYFTDGRRAVMVVTSTKQVPEVMNWD